MDPRLVATDYPGARSELLEVRGRDEPATRLNVTMLGLGTKGHGPVRDLVVGAAVHKLSNRSTVPVVLVPTDRSN